MYNNCDVGTRRKTLKDVAIELSKGTDNSFVVFLMGFLFFVLFLTTVAASNGMEF